MTTKFGILLAMINYGGYSFSNLKQKKEHINKATEAVSHLECVIMIVFFNLFFFYVRMSDVLNHV